MKCLLGGSAEGAIEEGLDKLARHARTVLIALAALQLGGAALLWVAGGVADTMVLGPQVVMGLVFIGLAIWARRSPTVPVSIGVGVYALSLVLVLVTNAEALLSMWGLIIHVILIALCINGLSSARAYRDMAARFRKSAP